MMKQYCDSGRQCVWWVEKFLADCVCGGRDYVSVGFGLISVVSWAVAEVPQICTNFKNGSTEGISLTFLMTWVVGDLFNLIGCWLEPATLPTQLYTALLYTITTIVLVLQIIYYDHFCKWWKAWKEKAQSKIQHKQISKSEHNDNNKTEPVEVPETINNSYGTGKKSSADSTKSCGGTFVSSLPVPTASPRQTPNTGRDLYIRSARSLASSHTPTPGSYVLHSWGSARSGPSYTLNQSSVDEQGLLTNLISSSPKNSNTILRSVASIALLVSGLNCLNLHTYSNIAPVHTQGRSYAMHIGRRVLHDINGGQFNSVMVEGKSSIKLGTCLGWLMAAIYMGGRFPQILLNITRGTVEGLNPLMFIFALIGNAAYVGSILVRTLDWRKLKPNMPWLIDAGVCVLLDFFILVQFIYYKIKSKDNKGAYQEGII